MTLALSQRTCCTQPQPNLMRTFKTSARTAASEDRKVGGSTPPLATTVTAGQTPVGLRFRVFGGPRSLPLIDHD